jgi:hypothetical protein
MGGRVNAPVLGREEVVVVQRDAAERDDKLGPRAAAVAAEAMHEARAGPDPDRRRPHHRRERVRAPWAGPRAEPRAGPRAARLADAAAGQVVVVVDQVGREGEHWVAADAHLAARLVQKKKKKTEKERKRERKEGKGKKERNTQRISTARKRGVS